MIQTKIELRFADFDMAGHVHNAAYLHFFESARIHFFRSELKPDWDWKKYGFILKKNTIEYHAPTFIHDNITAEVNCIHIGESSFTLHYLISDAQKTIKATGESVIVCYDYMSNQKIPIPDAILALLKKHLKS